jgi:hypothetical protein
VSSPAHVLPEVGQVHWRVRADERLIAAQGRRWTACAVAHVIPFVAAATVLFALEPLTFPVGIAALAHAWMIPELYARRGAGVLRRQIRRDPAAERTAVGLLGDLVGHEARELHARTGLVLERGRYGAWLMGELGAVLVRPGGRRVYCWCVRVDDPELPSADRVAHLLLALRADEESFATVANLTFSGAAWRLRRRLPPPAREGLDAARALARR